MICPKCKSKVASRTLSCEHCGFDTTVYRRTLKLSNLYYNHGLEKARVRDLSGAVLALHRSLEMNKRNTEARNLLGLVHFEMGEVVKALSEWVISKHFKPEHNDADYYMSLAQENPTKLDDMNQAIKKYNVALDAAKQGNEDLAIIQLKKVVVLNQKFLRSMLLLSLLYMKNNEFERAKKHLQKVIKIDISNTTALRYLKEIEKLSSGGTAKVPAWSDSSTIPVGKEKSFSPLASYREDKPNIMVFVNLILGVILGIAVVYYLIVPTMEQSIKEEYNNQKADYSSELSTKSAAITQLEKSVASLEKKLAEKESELKKFTGNTNKVEFEKESYNDYFTAISSYNKLKAKEPYTEEELRDVAFELYDVNTKRVDNQSAIDILENIRSEIYPLAARMVYKEGKAYHDAGNHEEAVKSLLAAVAFDPDADTPLYYLGKSYQALNKYEDAAKYYRLMLEVAPNSTLKQYIPQRLREMGMEVEP